MGSGAAALGAGVRRKNGLRRCGAGCGREAAARPAAAQWLSFMSISELISESIFEFPSRVKCSIIGMAWTRQCLIGTRHEFAAVVRNRCPQSQRQIVEVQEQRVGFRPCRQLRKPSCHVKKASYTGQSRLRPSFRH